MKLWLYGIANVKLNVARTSRLLVSVFTYMECFRADHYYAEKMNWSLSSTLHCPRMYDNFTYI
jgi:hypothetical protein